MTQPTEPEWVSKLRDGFRDVSRRITNALTLLRVVPQLPEDTTLLVRATAHNVVATLDSHNRSWYVHGPYILRKRDSTATSMGERMAQSDFIRWLSELDAPVEVVVSTVPLEEWQARVAEREYDPEFADRIMHAHRGRDHNDDESVAARSADGHDVVDDIPIQRNDTEDLIGPEDLPGVD